MNEKAINNFLEKMTNDQDFTAKVCQSVEASDVQKIAKAADIDLTLEDIMATKDIIYQMIDQHSEGELSENDLEDVSGGVIVTATAGAFIAAGVISAIGAVAGATIGGTGVLLGAISSVKNWKW